MNEESQIVPIGKLADMLSVPRAFLERETRAGRIPYLRAGNRVIYNPAAVRRALAERAALFAEVVADATVIR